MPALMWLLAALLLAPAPVDGAALLVSFSPDDRRLEEPANVSGLEASALEDGEGCPSSTPGRELSDSAEAVAADCEEMNEPPRNEGGEQDRPRSRLPVRN